MKDLEIRLTESTTQWQYSIWERTIVSGEYQYRFLGSDELWHRTPAQALERALIHVEYIKNEDK